MADSNGGNSVSSGAAPGPVPGTGPLGLGFVRALNEAAAFLQQSASSVEEVYSAVRQSVGQLGLTGGLALLQDGGQTLKMVAVAIPSHLRVALDETEQRIGVKAEGYTFEIGTVTLMDDVIRTGQPKYLASFRPVLEPMLPAAAGPLAGQILGVFAVEACIIAALYSQGKVIGALNVTGPGLTVEDVPALQAFSNHIAIALENARLISELRAGEARYRQLVEHSPSAIAVHRKGIMVYANPAALRLIGADSPEQVIGQPVMSFVHPDYRATVAQRVQHMMATGEPLPLEEEQFVRLDGRVIDVEVSSISLMYGGELAAQAVIQDVTHRKRAERERAAAQRVAAAVHTTRRLADLFQTIHEIVGELMPANNFFIALYDPATELISYPYAVDGSPTTWEAHVLGKSFTGYVIRSGQPLFAPPDVFVEMIRAGKTELLGAQCVDWIGVPLRTGGTTFGAMVVQTYDENVRLTEDDMRVLEIVSSQVAMAIERKRAEEEIRRREAILDAVGFAAEQFLRQFSWQDRIQEALERLGRAAEVSRVYIFENHAEPGGPLRARQLFEWAAPDVEPQIANPKLQTLDYAADGFGRLLEEFREGRAVYGQVREFPASERPLLEAQDIISIVMVPVLAGETLWGFIGFDECQRQRTWTAAEVDALGAAADTLGAAIHRRRTEETLERQASEFAALYATARDLAAPENLPALLNTIVERAVRLVGASAGDMYLFDPERQELEIIVSTDQTIHLGTRLGLGEGMAGRVAQTRQPLIIDDYEAWEHRSAKYESVRFRAVVQVPMLYGGDLVGVLGLHERGDVTRRFREGDGRLLSLIAALAAGAVHNARLLEATRRQLRELEAASQISTALRSAHNLDEMLPTLLDQTLDALNTGHGSIWLYDPATQELSRPAVRGWFARLEAAWLTPGEGIAGQVFTTGQAYYSAEFAADALVSAEARRYIPAGFGGVCIPFRTSHDSIVGGMFVSVQLPRSLTSDESRLLSTVAEIAGNAIQRSSLHEQTERRLQRLTALHSIETAITASLDLNVTLSVLLDHVTVQLGVDAAAVLLLKSPTQTLEFAAGRGFHTGPPLAQRLRLGEGYAGRAALERRVIRVAGLDRRQTDLLRAPLYAAEGFVAMYAVPLIAKGRVVGVLEIFGRSSLSVDAEWEEFLETLAQQTALAIDDAELFAHLQRSNVELSLAYDTTLEGWARALELRDAETEGHTRRVVSLSESLGRAMGLTEADLAQLRRGALLHDIGKVGIPDAILHKKGPLSPEEWEVMRRHPQYALKLLAPIGYLRAALDIPYCHHERWDGQGYPRGLQGDQIPLAARIFTVVDAWDALLSDRPYRPAWPKEKVRQHMREQAGLQFDPRIVDTFLEVESTIHHNPEVS